MLKNEAFIIIYNLAKKNMARVRTVKNRKLYILFINRQTMDVTF